MLVIVSGTPNELEKRFCRYEGDKVWVQPHAAPETVQPPPPPLAVLCTRTSSFKQTKQN